MRFLAIIFILSSQLLPGQELKRVVTTYPNKENVMEVYYVLKDDNTVKQGEYLSFYDHELTTAQLRKLNVMDLNKELLGFKEKGQYTVNKRTGKWIAYDAPHKNKSFTAYNARAEEGFYENDKKVGIWKTFAEGGVVTKQFDFDNNRALPTEVRVRPKYTRDARKNGAQGHVSIRVTYEHCEPISFKIIEDIGYGCAESLFNSLKEKREIEKKYGVESECKNEEEIADANFRLAE